MSGLENKIMGRSRLIPGGFSRTLGITPASSHTPCVQPVGGCTRRCFAALSGGHTLPPFCWTARDGSRRVFAFHHLCRERLALLQHTTVLGVARWQGSLGCVISRFVKRQALRRTPAAPATDEHPAGKRPRVAIVATSIYDVFTPGKTTTITYVDRTHKNVANELRLYLRRGGKFVSV